LRFFAFFARAGAERVSRRTSRAAMNEAALRLRFFVSSSVSRGVIYM
jgi:hypothetical protein